MELASRPAQSLFAYLLLNPNTRLRREKLSGMFWPEAGEANARSNLRHALWRMRKALGEDHAQRLETDDLGVIYHPKPGDWLDAWELLKAEGQDVDVDDLFRQVQAYGGELLPGFYEPWVTLERERLQAVYEGKAQRLLEALLARQRWAEVVQVAEQWNVQGTVPEPAYRALILAHAMQGSRAAALSAYQRCAEALQRELGVKPSPQTEALYAQVRQGAAPEALLSGLGLMKIDPTLPTNDAQPRPPQPEKTASPSPGREESAGGWLPQALTSFIGRRQELAELQALLVRASSQGQTNRLVTLCGAGGCGKTRLALQAARELVSSPAYPQSAWFVDLAPLSDAALIPQTLLAVLRVQQIMDQPPLEAVLDFLCTRRLLLILDNCEHLVTGCAVLVTRLLQTCPYVVVLATSQEALGVPGEVVYQVLPMVIPGEANQDDVLQMEAIQLFVERAAAVQPGGRELLEREAQLVANICRRLDGIPLAIELAAARTRMLTLHQIASRLDDSFRLLTGGSRAGLPHHQTLRAAIDWSYNLLNDQESRLFGRLAVFAGSWTLEAAEAVCCAPDTTSNGSLDCMDVLDLLTSLANKSIINVIHPAPASGLHDAAHPPVRYGMLETIRQYAHEKLVASGEQLGLQARFLTHYQDVARRAHEGLRGSEQTRWIAQLEQETDNLRLALETAFSTPATIDLGIQTVAALCEFWIRSSKMSEFATWREQVLAACGGKEVTPDLASALSHLAMVMLIWDEFDRLFMILPLLESDAAVLRSETLQGEGEARRVDYGRMLLVTGLVIIHDTRRSAEGRAYAEESIAVLRQAGDAWELGRALRMVGFHRYFIAQELSAAAWIEESADLMRQVCDWLGQAAAALNLGSVAYHQGDLVSAARFLQNCLELTPERGTGLMAYRCRNLQGEVALCQDDYDRAQAHYLDALVVLDQAGLSQEGSATGYYNVIYRSLGFVALRKGKVEQALAHFQAIVPAGNEQDQRFDLLEMLFSFAAVAAVAGQIEAAARLQGAYAALKHRLELEKSFLGTVVYTPADWREIEHYQALVREALDPQTYAAAWNAGQQMDLDQSLAYAQKIIADSAPSAKS